MAAAGKLVSGGSRKSNFKLKFHNESVKVGWMSCLMDLPVEGSKLQFYSGLV